MWQTKLTFYMCKSWHKTKYFQLCKIWFCKLIFGWIFNICQDVCGFVVRYSFTWQSWLHDTSLASLRAPRKPCQITSLTAKMVISWFRWHQQLCTQLSASGHSNSLNDMYQVFHSLSVGWRFSVSLILWQHVINWSDHAHCPKERLVYLVSKNHTNRSVKVWIT
jgi:hypothetical protein